MRTFATIAVTSLALVAGSSLQAADIVKKLSGGAPLNGTITSIGKSEVVIEKSTGATDRIPITDVEYVAFDGEPSSLKTVRTQVNVSGSYAAAIATLTKMDPNAYERPEIQHDIEFYRAYAKCKLALQTGADVSEPGQLLAAFIKNHPSSHHAYQANELLGDLLVKAKLPAEAQKYYNELAQSSIPEFKLRGNVAIGKSLIAAGKFSEAKTAFDTVQTLAGAQTGPVAEEQKLAATLGKARCIAEDGKVDEGVKMVEDVIHVASAEDAPLMANAYVTLGECWLKKPDNKQALLAFLHVDLLYGSQAEAHAAALTRLETLWKELGKTDRANDAKNRLTELYGSSAAAK